MGAKWRSWGWVSRGLLYFNQPGRLVRGPELVTGESAWAYRQGDRVGIYVDLQRGRLAFFLNGRQIAPAHDDPDLQSCLEPLHPAVVLSAIIVACACARVLTVRPTRTAELRRARLQGGTAAAA